MALSETIFKTVCTTLIKAATTLGGKKLAAAWQERKRLENKLEEVALQTFENIEPLFSADGVKPDQQEFILKACMSHLKPLLKKPEEFYRASLSGEKLQRQLFGSAGAPQEIVEEKLVYPFQLIFPRVADLFCSYLPLVAELRDKELIEVLRRFDEVQKNLAALQAQLTEATDRPLKGAEQHFHQLHRLTRSEVLGTLAFTGLHGIAENEISLDDVFVLPALVMQQRNKTETIADEAQTLAVLCARGVRAFVEGQPGSGKTTWTGWLQGRVLAQNPTRLAVRLRFRDFAKADLPSYYDLVRQRADKHLAARIKDEQIDRWIDDGRIVFLLDGFDEVAPTRRDEFLKWMTGLAETATSASILVTSRPLSTDHLTSLPKAWQRWSIAAFDMPRIQDYIRRWYSRCPFVKDERRNVDAVALAKQWSGDRTLTDLTGNPLMLGTLLAVHNRESQQLPRGRAKLYEKYIEGMLDLWEKRIAVQRDLDFPYDAKRKLLQHFALWFLQNNILTLGEEETGGQKGMHALVGELLPELKLKKLGSAAKHFEATVLAELRERTGMLDGPGTYSFVHKSVAEYLFAIAVNEGHLKTIDGEALDRHWLFQRRMDDRWLGVLYFWAGSTTVQNLQSFIVDSGKDADPYARLLELGLLYDQLDRLPKEFSREQIKRVIRAEAPSSRSRTRVTVSFGLPLPQSVKFRCDEWEIPALRQLTSVTLFHEFLRELGLLDVAAPDIPPDWASHLLFAMLRNLKDADSIRFAIELGNRSAESVAPDNSSLPFIRSGANAIALEILAGLIESATRADSPAVVQELVADLSEQFPVIRPLIPFIAIGVLARTVHEWARHIGTIAKSVEVIDHSLDFLRAAPMDKNILRQTHFCWEDFVGGNYDLIELCLKALNRLRDEPNTATLEAVRRVREYVQSLSDEREELWARHGKPTREDVNSGNVSALIPEAK